MSKFNFYLGIIILLSIKSFKTFSQIDSQFRSNIGVVKYGGVDINIPEFDGFIECLSLPKMTEISKIINYPGNRNLAMYINKSDFQELVENNDAEFSEIIRIYVSDDLEKSKFSLHDFERFDSLIKSNFIEENWEKLSPKLIIENEHFEWKRPVLIDSYRHSNSVFTHVFLLKYIFGVNEYYYLCAGNMILTESKSVWFAYYNLYEGQESVSLLKKRNDYQVFSFLSSN
jgi:hypothetical protein